MAKKKKDNELVLRILDRCIRTYYHYRNFIGKMVFLGPAKDWPKADEEEYQEVLRRNGLNGNIEIAIFAQEDDVFILTRKSELSPKYISEYEQSKKPWSEFKKKAKLIVKILDRIKPIPTGAPDKVCEEMHEERLILVLRAGWNKKTEAELEKILATGGS